MAPTYEGGEGMTKPTRIPARPTVYDGIPMRSRLEAKFAAWLDRVYGKGSWTYEPRCYASQAGQYLPDFEVHRPKIGPAKSSHFIEVKPTNITASELFATLDKMMLIWRSEPGALISLIVLGNDEQTAMVFFGVNRCDCGKCDLCVIGVRWYVDVFNDPNGARPMPQDEALIAELLNRWYGTASGGP